MTRFLVLLLWVSLLPIGVWAAEEPVMPLGSVDFALQAPYLTVSHTPADVTSISLLAPGVVEEDKAVDYRQFKVFGIPGEPFRPEEGYPTVPHVTRFYRIPNTGSVDLVLRDAQFDVVDNVDIAPYQEEGSPVVVPTATVDGWYPANVAEMSEPMVMRDFRVVLVTLNPVQVNPATRQVRIYRSVNVDVVPNDRPGINEITVSHPPSGAYASLYRSQIVNLDDQDLVNATTRPGTYLIICSTNASYRPWADSLFEWKTRKGFRVVIDARSNWQPTTMVSAIQTMYANSDPPLEYVCLVGDPSGSGVPTNSSDQTYDHNFGRGNNNDQIEDIAVGRLSGQAGEMQTIIAKIMGYERTPYMADTTWFHHAYLTGDISGHPSPAISNYRMSQWGAWQLRHFTCINNSFVDYSNGSFPTSQTLQQFQNGICFFSWRGSWIGQQDDNAPGQTNPGWKLPICVGITCASNEFASGSGFMEKFLTVGSPSQPRGGVASVGTSTTNTHQPPNICLSGGVIYNICELGVEHFGTAIQGAKFWLFRTFLQQSSFPAAFSGYCNLMGDPGLSIWTCVPTILHVTHPTALNVGARQIAVTVTDSVRATPIAGAVVTAWKRGTDSTYAVGLTDVSGQLTLPLNVNAAGDLLLTVTKQNVKPYLYTIPCISADNMVMYSSYVLDDDNAGGTHGNGDGAMNPGEVMDLTIWLKNFGSNGTIHNITGTVTSNNSRVQVVSGSSTYPDLTPNQEAPCVSAFRIQVSSLMQDREPVQLTLTVNSSAGQSAGCIELRCVAPAVAFSSTTITGFGPGTTQPLRVTIRNTGHLGMTGTTAHLTSLSPFVQTDDPDATFGDIAVGSSQTNTSDPFTVTANSMTFRGLQAPMRLITTTSDGMVDTVTFVLAVGTALSTDPSGPDGYGYYAYDNTDASYEMHPTFGYVNIAQSGNRLGLNDPGEAGTATPAYSVALRLPFTFKFYGQRYDTITICSNGWCAFGDQSYNDLFRNYAIPAMQAPDAMIAPYWDDLQTSNAGTQGVYISSDVANHRYIIQWKAGGGYTNFTTPLDFEVILLDTTYYPTFDGNGQVLVQYQTVQTNLQGDTNDEPGCTVGIQDQTCTVGLNYLYEASYAPGAATLTTGRAILFTTNARMLFGQITGHVTDAANGLSLPNVNLSIDGYGYHTVTDSFGRYQMPNVLIGTYTVRAQLHRYNDATTNNVIVQLDSTVTANLSMTHPALSLSSDSLMLNGDTSMVQTSFDIRNTGNGPSDYNISVYYGGTGHVDPWDSVGGVAVSTITQNHLVQGCEFVGDEWWVTGGGGGQGPNLIYRFARNGLSRGTIPQPGTSAVGWFDMAYDGRYVFGSDDHEIVGIDRSGNVRMRIPSPLNPTRALAYDPSSHHFFAADYTTDIFELDTLGNIVNQIPNPTGHAQLAITGLAWNATDTDGFKLYIFSQNGSTTLSRVSRMLPVSPYTVQTIVDLPGVSGDRAGGATVTGGWNSTLLVFAGIIRSPIGDRLSIYELNFNTTWINISPAASTVPGGNTQTIHVQLDPRQLIPDTYRVTLHVASQVYDSTFILPVRFFVRDLDVPRTVGRSVPFEYALHQNYPNPFNPVTLIRYDLKEAGHTQLVVYDIMGRKVADLVNAAQAPGSYEVPFTAENLPSGVYFYRLQSGHFTSTSKMVLMK